MIQMKPISGFEVKLPEAQIVEDKYKDVIKRNYNLSGFVSLDTSAVERLDVLTSKGADDSEIYTLKRIHSDGFEKSSIGLRFDLTVPLARYIAQYEGELTFPFKRQQIGRSYRGERPQSGRYREFYQADVDIIGNGKLPLFADVEIISTIYNSLKELSFGDFIININNKKFLVGFLNSIGILDKDIVNSIKIIDKKDKVREDKLDEMFKEIGINEKQIDEIKKFINEKESPITSFIKVDENINKLMEEGRKELKYVYDNLLKLGVKKENLKINSSISRGLDYYTGTVFETFIDGEESMGSISSGGRYENLAGNFTKNSFPGVGGSIGLSRLLAILNKLGKIEYGARTVSQVMVVNMGDNLLTNNLQIVNKLRKNGVNVEIFLDGNTKIQKQLKYANNKRIPFVIIQGADEIKNNVIQLKNLSSGEQKEIEINSIENILDLSNHYF